MVYLVTNITDISNDPKTIYIGDIPNRTTVEIAPGQTVDLENLSTRNQILESTHLRSLIASGQATADTLGTPPRERFYVDAEINQIRIESVNLTEPLAISAFVNGVETNLHASNFEDKIGLDVFPVYPSVPSIQNITVATANTVIPVTLPIDSKRFLVKVRESDALMYLAFQSGGSSIMVRKGVAFVEENVDASSLTLYVKVDQAPRTIEVLSWAYASST